MDNIMTNAERRERYVAWVESFGFSGEDKRRIRDLVAQVTPNACPAALDDLSIPVRVGVCLAKERRRRNGELLGVVGDIALLYWPMAGAEIDRWQARRRRRR